ncbi:MAG: acetolactate synthase small subunit [Bacteroidales bacterium]|nr:acetolactate synthase small subunit [Bacteroidales bacterium]
MYIISVYSENQVGLLSSISQIFTRRNINIESLTVFPSEFPGVHHFTFRVVTDEFSASQVVKFIEKKVEVLRAYWYESNSVSAGEHDDLSAYLIEKDKTQK